MNKIIQFFIPKENRRLVFDKQYVYVYCAEEGTIRYTIKRYNLHKDRDNIKIINVFFELFDDFNIRQGIFYLSKFDIEKTDITKFDELCISFNDLNNLNIINYDENLPD